MRVLVTGGAGFIGSHVTDAYLRAGHDVTIVDDLSTGRRENVAARAHLIEMDICSADLNRVFAEERFDLVSHHAAQMDVRRSVADPVFDARVNVIGLLNLLERCIAHRVGRVIFASTGGAIYGEQEQFPAPETHPTLPLSPYGVAKLASERYLHYYGVTYGLRATVLRYANVYGPRQDPHGEAGVVAIFAQRLLSGQAPIINGDGLQTRDFVHVSDVVRANLLALARAEGGVFNVGTGVEVTVKDLLRTMSQCAGARSGTETYGPAKKGEQRRSVIDPARARQILGWSPEVTLAQGVASTVDFFRARSQRST